jgi:hypothetical protein
MASSGEGIRDPGADGTARNLSQVVCRVAWSKNKELLGEQRTRGRARWATGYRNGDACFEPTQRHPEIGRRRRVGMQLLTETTGRELARRE